MARKRRKSAVQKGMMKGLMTGLRLLLVVLIAAFLIFLGKTAYSVGFGVFSEQSMAEAPGEDVSVTILSGKDAWQIGKTLQKEGLIENALTFVLSERLSPYHGKLLSGEYLLNTSMTPSQILAAMAGKTDP